MTTEGVLWLVCAYLPVPLACLVGLGLLARALYRRARRRCHTGGQTTERG